MDIYLWSFRNGLYLKDKKKMPMSNKKTYHILVEIEEGEERIEKELKEFLTQKLSPRFKTKRPYERLKKDKMLESVLSSGYCRQ